MSVWWARCESRRCPRRLLNPRIAFQMRKLRPRAVMGLARGTPSQISALHLPGAPEVQPRAGTGPRVDLSARGGSDEEACGERGHHSWSGKCGIENERGEQKAAAGSEVGSEAKDEGDTRTRRGLSWREGRAAREPEPAESRRCRRSPAPARGGPGGDSGCEGRAQRPRCPAISPFFSEHFTDGKNRSARPSRAICSERRHWRV